MVGTQYILELINGLALELGMGELAGWGHSGESSFETLWWPKAASGPVGLNHCLKFFHRAGRRVT